MTVSRNRVIAVLVPPPTVMGLVIEAQRITTQMTGNAFFPKPTPSLATVIKLTDTLRQREVATKTRAVGTVPARNTALKELLVALHALKAYVQQIADQNPTKAASIIISAGFAVKRPKNQSKRPFEVRQGEHSGEARLIARAQGKRVTYFWQLSDDGGETFKDAGATLQASITLKGLVRGKAYRFRFAVLTKDGRGDWSNPIEMIVK